MTCSTVSILAEPKSVPESCKDLIFITAIRDQEPAEPTSNAFFFEPLAWHALCGKGFV